MLVDECRQKKACGGMTVHIESKGNVDIRTCTTCHFVTAGAARAAPPSTPNSAIAHVVIIAAPSAESPRSARAQRYSARAATDTRVRYGRARRGAAGRPPRAPRGATHWQLDPVTTSTASTGTDDDGRATPAARAE